VKPWLRWAMLVYGISAFVWLSLEDSSLMTVTLLGIAGAILALISVILPKLAGRRISPRWLPLLLLLAGAVVGLGSRVLMVALMFFKNARHAHQFLDYPPDLMLATLQSALLWALAGALIGLSLSLGWLALRPGDSATEST
jgi:hypothetical protein